jgi:hypothetical protein
MAVSKKKKSSKTSAASPPRERITSPQAVMLFLKQAGLEREWTARNITNALGIGATTAKQVAAELALMGYAEPVPRKPETWRNTDVGDKVAGVRPPRLTREKAEELLADIGDRAAEINLKDQYPVRIIKIGAFGGVMTKHDRIQDIDLIVKLEPKPKREVTEPDRRAALKALRGKSPVLKPRVWDQGLADLPVRVIFEDS